MKVAILKSRLSITGGSEKYTLRTAKSFADRGCEVTVLTTGTANTEGSLPLKMVSLGSASKISFLHLKQFDCLCSEWLKANRVDIVFGMDRNSSQTHYRAGNGVHAEYLKKRASSDSIFKRLSFSLNPLHRTILRLERKTYEDPNLKLLFTNSAMVRDEIIQHYNTDPRKIQVVHNGVEWEEMQGDFDQWSSRRLTTLKELGLKPSCYQFLFIGNGYRRKGLQHLLWGIARLPSKVVQLSIVGKDKEAKYFISMVHKLGLGDQVKFFGPRSDIRRFYQAADALVLPSLYDPFANVTVEALAMGLFVVSSKTNGGHEVLTESTGAVISDLFDDDSLVRALQIALLHPKTPSSAAPIRASVRHLSFSNQLEKMISATLKT